MNYTFIGRVPEWLTDIVAGVGYKPGWTLRIEALNFMTMYSITAQCTVKDVVTGEPTTLYGRGANIYKDQVDEKMIVRMIFHCIRELEYHEMEEQFSYRGVRVFNPHQDSLKNETLFASVLGHPEV